MRNIIVLITSLMILSCSTNSNRQEETTIDEISPEFKENKFIDEFESSYKSRGGSLIDNLFREAIKRNNDLGELEKTYQSLIKNANDSLNDYSKYDRQVKEYFEAYNDYLGYSNDSTLHNKYIEKLENQKEFFNEFTVQHASTAERVSELKKKVNTQHTLLKLDVSEQLMRNFMTKEIPSSKPMENLEKEYQSFSDEIEKFSKKLNDNK